MFKVFLRGVAVFAASTIPLFADEETARRDALFNSLDKDGNGVLTPAEIPPEKTDLFKRLMTLGDANKDQQLTKDEFLAALKSPPRAEPRDPVPGQGPGEFDPVELVKRLDGNGDGQLSRDEIPEPMRERLSPLFDRLGKDAVTAEDLAALRGILARLPRPEPVELFKRLDANQDDRLTLEEVPELLRGPVQAALQRLMQESLSLQDFSAAIAPRDGQPPNRPDMSGRGPRIVAILDTDGDGQLSKQELAMAPYHFDELDANRDGRIDPRELFSTGPPGESTSAANPDRPRMPAESSGETPRSVPADPKTEETPTTRAVDPRGFAQRFFAQFDANKDGFLSPDEVPAGRVADELDQMDADGDGRISTAEFEAAVLRRRGDD